MPQNCKQVSSYLAFHRPIDEVVFDSVILCAEMRDNTQKMLEQNRQIMSGNLGNGDIKCDCRQEKLYMQEMELDGLINALTRIQDVTHLVTWRKPSAAFARRRRRDHCYPQSSSPPI